MSGLASAPPIWSSIDDRRADADADADASDEDVAHCRSQIVETIASIEAWVASLGGGGRQDLAYHQTEAACNSPTSNQLTRTTPRNVASIWASVGGARPAAAVAADEDLAYHRMEAACPPSPPTPNQQTRRTPASSNRPAPSDFWRIALWCYMTFPGIILTVSPFVWRYAYHDPMMQQNPLAMILLACTGLVLIAFGFALTSDDCLQGR